MIGADWQLKSQQQCNSGNAKPHVAAKRQQCTIQRLMPSMLAIQHRYQHMSLTYMVVKRYDSTEHSHCAEMLQQRCSEALIAVSFNTEKTNV